MQQNWLPSVLTFPGTKQNSLSMERALKNVIEMLEAGLAEVPNDDMFNRADRYQAAIDDARLMLGAIHR